MFAQYIHKCACFVRACMKGVEHACFNVRCKTHLRDPSNIVMHVGTLWEIGCVVWTMQCYVRDFRCMCLSVMASTQVCMF